MIVKCIHSLLIIFSTFFCMSQDKSFNSVNECEQYHKILDVVKTDSFQGAYRIPAIHLEIDTVIQSLSKDRFMPRVAIISIDLDKPLRGLSSDTIMKYWRLNYEDINDSVSYYFNCDIDSSPYPNLKVSFERLGSNIVYVRTSRIFTEPGRHSYGRVYVFKFDEQNNFKLRKWGWQA